MYLQEHMQFEDTHHRHHTSNHYPHTFHRLKHLQSSQVIQKPLRTDESPSVQKFHHTKSHVFPWPVHQCYNIHDYNNHCLLTFQQVCLICQNKVLSQF